MELLNKRRVGTLALGLVMSFGLVACGGESPTATAVPKAAPTNTTAAAAPTNTTAAAAPTNTTAAAAPTNTVAMVAEPTATTGSSGTGSTGALTGGAAEIEAAAKGMKDVKTYHMDITSDAAGMSTKMSADVDAVNKSLRITTDAAGQKSTIVVVGSDAWISMDGGTTFIKDPSNGATAEGIKPFLTMWDSVGMGSSGTPPPEGAIKAGTPATESIEGTETNHWIIDSAAMGGGTSGTSGSVEMWVTTGSDPTIRQMKTSSTAAGQTSNVLITWSKINEDIKIEAPKTP